MSYRGFPPLTGNGSGDIGNNDQGHAEQIPRLSLIGSNDFSFLSALT
jgi:hypothetical protein